MTRREVPTSKEQVKFSTSIILATSEIHEMWIEEWGEKRVIDGRVVIGAKKRLVGKEEQVLSGLGIQDAEENLPLLIEAFRFYGNLDLPSLIIASKILGLGIKKIPDFAVSTKEALAAYYLTQDGRNDNIFGILGSRVQTLLGITNQKHPDFHPLVNEALLSFPPAEFNTIVDTIARVASLRNLPCGWLSLVEAEKKGIITRECDVLYRGYDQGIA